MGISGILLHVSDCFSRRIRGAYGIEIPMTGSGVIQQEKIAGPRRARNGHCERSLVDMWTKRFSLTFNECRYEWGSQGRKE